MPDLPRKLLRDPIAEALCEWRFTSSKSEQLPELALASLSGNPDWVGYETVRMPVADIPFAFRQKDPALKFQPLLELRGKDRRIAKLGSNALSYHALAPYPGWEIWGRELERITSFLFRALAGVSITRMGLRYLNMFNPETHGVIDPTALNIRVEVAQQAVKPPLGLNFMKDLNGAQRAHIRIASKEYVQGAEGPVGVAVDVDVFTPDGVVFDGPDSVARWIETAHDAEKVEFFALFTERMKRELI